MSPAKKPRAANRALRKIPFGAAGLPAKDSVTAVTRLRTRHGTITILKTTEHDAYDAARASKTDRAPRRRRPVQSPKQKTR